MNIHLTKIGNKINPPVIFLHGLFGQGDDFVDIANLFSDRYYSILIDLPGHGKSDVLEEKSFSDLCHKIMESIPTSNQKATLVGYSLGGRIALYLCTHFPQNFNQAVIISANPGIETGREERLKQDLSLLEKISSPDLFFKDWYSKPLFGNLLKHKNFPVLLDKRKESDLLKINEYMSSFSVGTQPSLWGKIRDNTLPIFYFCGEKDEKYKEIGLRLSKFPSINFIEFENAGHYLHFEHPTTFYNYLTSLLKQQDQV